MSRCPALRLFLNLRATGVQVLLHFRVQPVYGVEKPLDTPRMHQPLISKKASVTGRHVSPVPFLARNIVVLFRMPFFNPMGLWETAKKVCDCNVHRFRLLDGRSMTSMRDDLQARASDTLMQALGVDRRNSDILVSDKYQRRNPNPVDLALYAFAGDDASGGPCNAKSMVSAHTMSPLAALKSARRVGEKGPPEHDRHHPVDYQTQTKPAGNERELPVLCDILARLWIGGS